MRPETTSPRNDALDLARFAAAAGVIFIHCAPTTPAAGTIVIFAQNVAVPFFLLSSLYLFWREVRRGTPPRAALVRRWPRLVGPYLVWTALYLGARLALGAAQGSPAAELVRHGNWLQVLFTGGAAVQLYFLPLLLLGLVMSAVLAALRPRVCSSYACARADAGSIVQFFCA